MTQEKAKEAAQMIIGAFLLIYGLLIMVGGFFGVVILAMLAIRGC